MHRRGNSASVGNSLSKLTPDLATAFHVVQFTGFPPGNSQRLWYHCPSCRYNNLMFMILLVLLFAACLLAVAWGGTLWLQGYIYSEPCEDLYWRAPALAAIMALFVGFWCSLHVSSARGYDTLFRFTGTDFKTFDKAWAVTDQQIKDGTVDESKLGKPYERRDNRFVRDGRPWSESDAVVVEDGDAKVIFKAERDENNKYKREGGDLKYTDSQGRVMYASRLGEVSISRTGRVFGNLALNALHFVLWFACIWFLLRYQWPHALGLAVIAWLVMTLIILPMMFDSIAKG